MALFKQDQAALVDFAGRDARRLREGIVGRHSKQKGIVEQTNDLDVPLRRRHRQHHRVEIAGDQLVDQGALVCVSRTLTMRSGCLSLLSGWSPTICGHTAPRLEISGSNAGMSAGDGRTIELRIRISRRGGGSARWSGSRACGQPRDFFPHTPPSTTPSMFNAISSQLKRTACFALTRWPRGGPQSQRPDNF